MYCIHVATVGTQRGYVVCGRLNEIFRTETNRDKHPSSDAIGYTCVLSRIIYMYGAAVYASYIRQYSNRPHPIHLYGKYRLSE